MSRTRNGARRGITRLLSALGLAAGTALVARPERLVRAVAPEFPRDRLWIARLLGARLVAQHAAVLIAPSPALVRFGSAVDLVHAASMVPFVASPRYGRTARISGGVAAAYAAIALGTASRPAR